MPATSTPAWSAPRNGLIGDAAAVANTGQVNQLLGTHADQLVYAGNAITTNTINDVGLDGVPPWSAPLSQYDIDQPFTMSGTSVGRVTVGMLPVGQGADVLVSLCADNSGEPGTVVAQTRIPANWIYQQAVVAGTATGMPIDPTVTYTGNPLATAQSTAIYRGAAQTIVPYPIPARNGPSANASTTWYYPYMIQIGGVNNNTALTSVLTTQYGPNGAYGTSVQQQAFPTANDGSSASCTLIDPSSGNVVIVNTGGGNSFLGPAVATTYTATLDDTTGIVSAWTIQNALPYAVQSHTMVAANGYVYVIGGKNSGGLLNNVTYANVQNSQIGTWTAATPLPSPRQVAYVAASNGCLFVIGGADASFNPLSDAWYAPLDPETGAVGAWIALPNLPFGLADLNNNAFANDYGILCPVGNAPGAVGMAFLPVTVAGPGNWTATTLGLGIYAGWSDLGDGSLALGGIANAAVPPAAYYYPFWHVPCISVPLPASGLTSGATYHVLIQQRGGDLNNYTSVAMLMGTVSPGQSSPPGRYTWSPWAQGSHTTGAAIVVYDGTAPSIPSIPVHTWEDGGARIATYVQASTPDRRLLGVCDAVRQEYAQNSNSGFESGIAPWAVAGGTVVQSSTEVDGASMHAAQITPSGTAATVSLASEMLPCMPGQSITVDGRMWFTSAVTSNASLSVAWYSLTGTPISTSATTVSVPAATWSEQKNLYTAPAGAYQYEIVAQLTGTPAASQVWYVDTVRGYPTTAGPQLATVTQVDYASVWPAPTQPSGTTQLA